MRDNKRGTIEDPSTDRVLALALAFEQKKQERLLDETAHSVRVSEELAKEIPPLAIDLTILRDDEVMIAQVQAENEAAEDFIDGFFPRGVEYTVIDSGRILIHTDGLDQVTKAADALGLSYEITAR